MRRILVTTVALAGLFGCTSPLLRAPENGESAVYILSTVDDRPLPGLLGAGSSIGQELTEGMLQLREDGTFFLDLTYMIYTPAGPRRVHRPS